MPITPLYLNFNHDDEAIINALRFSKINGKGQNEIFHSLDALKIRGDWFTNNYGALTAVDHHSNPDDPPDLTLHFANADVPLEHTELKPHPFGMVDAIHHGDCPEQCITVPSLSKGPKTRNEITNAMFSFEADAWADSTTERKEWLSELKLLVDRKMKKQKTGILLVQDTALRMSSDVKQLATDFAAEMRTAQPSVLGECILILHSRLNTAQYASFLIQEGQPLQERVKL